MKVKVYGWDYHNNQRKVFETIASHVRIKAHPFGQKNKKIVFEAEYSACRIAEVPDGYFEYSIRGNDNDGADATIENTVFVNHNADILVKQDLGDLSGDRFLEIDDVDYLSAEE